MGVVFVDCETTGLDPDRHEVWEVALIGEGGSEWVYRIRPENLARADPNALRINHFYVRTTPAGFFDSSRRYAADQIALLTAGQHLVGAVPSFDAAFLAAFLRSEHLTPAWHYHLVDVEAMAAGALGVAPPWDSDDLAHQLGLPLVGDRHEALLDARWARTMYTAALSHHR